MLTPEETRRIDKCLSERYSCSNQDYKDLEKADLLILECSLDPAFANRSASALLDMANDIKRKMNAIFIFDDGVSPRLIEYQERYFQLLQIHCQVTGQDDTEPLALLAFSTAFDLFWLQSNG